MLTTDRSPDLGLSVIKTLASGPESRAYHNIIKPVTPHARKWPYVVHIWSRNSPEFGAHKTLALHPVDRLYMPTPWTLNPELSTLNSAS